ncbi:MAG: hypothetical protein JW862_08665 [Anaerolineales bacterium]|nr:hypothetical protein [Anaerolineales bacterium]
MLTPADLIQIPYTPDLTQAGIAYAGRSLPYTYDRMGGHPDERLRRIVAGKAVELAFKRYLHQEQVPHDFLGLTPFTDPDQYDVAIGGRRCDLKSFLLTDKRRIRAVRQEPDLLLSAPALVPSDQCRPDPDRDGDLYIFAFLSALLAPGWSATRAAQQAGQPLHLMFALPPAWARPKSWGTLGTLVLKSNCQQRIKVEVGGQGAERQFQAEQIMLIPGQRTHTRQDFHTLSHIHTPHLPDGPVGVYSPQLDESLVIEPGQWANVWVYGLELWLVGYITRQEFQSRARLLPAGKRVFQYARTRTENLSLAMTELLPLADLFQRARGWKARQK